VSIAYKNILEAALLAAGKPLNLEQISALFADHEKPAKADMVAHLRDIQADYEGRGMALVELASGYQMQVRADYASWVSRLWEDKPAKYSRALLETLAIIAYRQPITRGEIEDIRGVAVSSNIIKTLVEREWVRVVGHRDVPGRPSILGTTRQFLDYFGLKTLNDLPTLSELRDLDDIGAHLEANLAADVKLTLVAGGAEQPEHETSSAALTLIHNADVQDKDVTNDEQ